MVFFFYNGYIAQFTLMCMCAVNVVFELKVILKKKEKMHASKYLEL